MSPSTFRHHFRAVVGMSPLQYLKNLRLQDARQRILNENLDAGSAASKLSPLQKFRLCRKKERRC